MTPAVDALALAGLVKVRSIGNERRVSLATKSSLLPGLRAPVPQSDWVNQFGAGLQLLRFLEVSESISPTVFAIEARRIVDIVHDRLSIEGAPLPRPEAVGDEFVDAFYRWLMSFMLWLREPSRT